MTEGRLTRRELLTYSLAGGLAVWAGSGPAHAANLFTAQRVNPDRFPQSVASGDPRPDGIVLWTRVAPLPSGATVQVAYEIATEDDADFTQPVLRGMAETGPQRDDTVKVALRRSELQPATGYRYRFLTGGDASEAISALRTIVLNASNPHIEFLDSTTHGYNLLDIAHDELVCTMKAVDTIQQRQSRLRTPARFRVPAGRVEIERDPELVDLQLGRL